MKRLTVFCIILSIFTSSTILGQNKQNKAVYKEKKDGFYQNTIQKGIQEFESSHVIEEPKNYLSVDFKDQNYPTNIDDYKQFWHNPPLSQGSTGTCWCYSGTSFAESEIFRVTGKKVKLSEMYIVYWEYVERAKYFVENRGEMNFGEGSETNAVLRMMKKYGAVPVNSYTGMLEGQIFHNHSKMFDEMDAYLNGVKESNNWNTLVVSETIISILNHYMGEPPLSFQIDNMEYSPETYLSDYLKFIPSDYFSFMSTLSKTYNEQGELVEPDNWWHCDNYYNVDMNNFLSIFKNALKEGYTLSFCGDVSEPGYDRYKEVGIVPSFDIPAEYINEDARELRISNGSTNDDHCMHIVGYLENDDAWWFLIKDSSSSGFDGPNKGYRFLHEDYIKLKILTILVYKYGAKDVLDKIIK